MKKKNFLVGLSVLVFLISMCLLIGYVVKNFTQNYFENSINYSFDDKKDEMNNTAVFYVYEQEIKTDDKTVINYNTKSCHIPLLAMCKAMGARVEHLGKSVVFIIFEDTTYVLNIKNETLKEVGSNINFIAYPPGGGANVRFFNNSNEEVFIDHLSLTRFVRNRKAFIKMDFEINTIYIIQE